MTDRPSFSEQHDEDRKSVAAALDLIERFPELTSEEARGALTRSQLLPLAQEIAIALARSGGDPEESPARIAALTLLEVEAIATAAERLSEVSP